MNLKIKNIELPVYNANTFWKRLFGLMFKKNINYGLIFNKTNAVHTFFMKENIDIIALNNENKIIYKKINVPKNKIIIVKNKVKKTSILELPKNTSLDLNINDYINLYK